MDFKNWFLNEGKAMEVSQDMKNFAIEVSDKLEKKDWQFDQIIHERIVESKYGKKNVRVKIELRIKKNIDGNADVQQGVSTNRKK